MVSKTNNQFKTSLRPALFNYLYAKVLHMKQKAHH